MRTRIPRPELPRAAVLVCLLLAERHALAETVLLEPGDDVEAAINAAQPGDEIVLAGGSYELTERFGISVHGTQGAPIVVRAADGERPHLHREATDQNVIDVDDAEHVVLRGLELSGGSHGLRLVSARFFNVERCEIHDTGDVALSANSGGQYQALRILGNHIHHTNGTGEGMYLGCNDNGCQMFDSLIAGNYVHHTDGPTVEQGDGIEIKEGSYNNVVRDNVIHDTNYPCILTYSTVGNGAPNVIERNVLWNCGDHAIQSAADATIRNNVILGASADGIAMQPHQAGAPSRLIVVHNTVLMAMNDAISASGIVGSVVIANNALYAPNGHAISAAGDLAQLVLTGNVGMGAVTPPGSSGYSAIGMLAADFVGASFSGAPPNDVFPKSGSALIAAGDADHVANDDFNGTARNGAADVGAYAFDAAGNPGWMLGAGFKDAPPTVEVPDAGSAGQSGDAGAGGPPANAGSDLEDAGGAGAGANGAAADDAPEGGAVGEVPRSDAGGCGCRVLSRPFAPRRGFLFALLAAVGLARTRRRPRGGCA
jgi:hypothetical protein